MHTASTHRTRLRLILGATCAMALACAAVPSAVLAQSAAKNIRWVVPYPAGGGSDFIARNVALGIQKDTGANVIVDNKPGGNGAVAVADIKRAAKDGGTWINVDNGIMVFNPALYTKLGYQPATDLRPVTLLGTLPMILLAGPAAEVNTAKEWLAKVKASPGKYSYGSAGAGSPQHMAMELLKKSTGTHIVHIPYRGSTPALSDLAGGQIPVLMSDYAAARSFIQAGKIKPLAVASNTRMAELPDVPTLAELGIRNSETSAWVGVAMPAGSSDESVQQAYQSIRTSLADKDVSQKLRSAGIELVDINPEQFAAKLKTEQQSWGQLIRELNIKLD